MDITTIITIAAIVMANIGTTIGLFTWATSQAAEDSRETKRLIESESKETKRILEAIQAEMKDFHGRLCKIEERNRKEQT